MKALFLLLVLLNLALFAWQRGWLGTVVEAGHEPARLARQINPERVRVLTPQAVEALTKAGKSASNERPAAPVPPTAAAAAPAPLAGNCLQLGDFEGEAIARARSRLDAVAPGARLTVRTVAVPGWYLVFLPPLKTRADAERQIAELRQRGLSDIALIGEGSSLRNGVALGSFRDPQLAARRRAEVEAAGAKGARVSERPTSVEAARFEVRGIDAAQAQALTELQKEFEGSRLEACTS
jgi:hypothetical protein